MRTSNKSDNWTVAGPERAWRFVKSTHIYLTVFALFFFYRKCGNDKGATLKTSVEV